MIKKEHIEVGGIYATGSNEIWECCEIHKTAKKINRDLNVVMNEPIFRFKNLRKGTYIAKTYNKLPKFTKQWTIK